MSSSPPERRPVTAADFERLGLLVRVAERALGREPATGAADLREWSSAVDLEADTILLEHDRDPIAFGWIFVREGVAYAFGTVHPSAWARGLGTELAAFCERRARERGARTVRTDVLGGDERAAELFRLRGYQPVKRFYELVGDLDAPPPQPLWPDGIAVAPFHRDDAAAFHAALEEAFAGDWGFVTMPFADWFQLRVELADTSLYFVARDGDEIAGVVRCEPERHGIGWVGALAVREPWRGRGLGRALLLHALAAFYERGRRRVGLGVDADNSTGALSLYESVGMKVVAEELVYERQLA